MIGTRLRLLLLLFAPGLLAVAPSAAAVEPDAPGFSLRLRSGVGLPAGDQDDQHELSETYGVLVPIDLEAGWFVVPRLFLGAHGSFGILTIAGDACGEPLECSGTHFRFGAAAEYRFDVQKSFEKWASLGVGYEIARFAIERSGAKASRVDAGPEYLQAQIGGDFMLEGGFSVGPFLGASLGEFRTATLHQADGTHTTYAIDDPKLHQWYLIGVRGGWTP